MLYFFILAIMSSSLSYIRHIGLSLWSNHITMLSLTLTLTWSWTIIILLLFYLMTHSLDFDFTYCSVCVFCLCYTGWTVQNKQNNKSNTSVSFGADKKDATVASVASAVVKTINATFVSSHENQDDSKCVAMTTLNGATGSIPIDNGITWVFFSLSIYILMM